MSTRKWKVWVVRWDEHPLYGGGFCMQAFSVQREARERFDDLSSRLHSGTDPAFEGERQITMTFYEIPRTAHALAGVMTAMGSSRGSMVGTKGKLLWQCPGGE